MTEVQTMREILTRSRTIAVVGISANPERPSHEVARFLWNRGYQVIGVNPGLAGQTLFGTSVVADIADLPDGVDMIDIFRAPDAVPGIVGAVLARFPHPPAIWMQIGVGHAAAADQARAAGAQVVMDRCPLAEWHALFGTTGPAGLVPRS